MIAWPEDVIRAIARRRSVIMIGSGVSANSVGDNGERPPTWGEFLDKAYAALGRRIPHVQSALRQYRYLEACDYLKREHAENCPNLIRSFFITPKYKHATIHKHLFELDSRIVMSMNFDKIFDNYAVAASEGTVVIKNHYDKDIRQSVAGQDRYVIKPHGTVDSISQMIFTIEDYALARVKYREFYEVMNALLHTHTFICIGCGLSDPDLQLIFEDYRYKHGEMPHYIAMPKPVSDPERELIRRTRGLNPILYSPRDGHKELTESLGFLVAEVAKEREVIQRERNW